MRRYGNTFNTVVEADVDVEIDIDEFFDQVSDDELLSEVDRRELKVRLPENSLMLSDGDIEKIAESLLRWLPKDRARLLQYLNQYATSVA
jgi:hypothetical protein